ncbi:MAG: hypothetical protein JWO04_5255 [Gammaproteobacteria bacterium]|nr:hypothetical protein [Gammaproteobacteria bacterium]
MASNQRSPAWKTGPHLEWYTKEVLDYGPRIMRGFVFSGCFDDSLFCKYPAGNHAKADRLFTHASRAEILLSNICALDHEFQC